MELSNTLQNVDNTDKNDYSSEIKYFHIENSPFTIVKEKEQYFAVLGKHRVTENYESKKECEEETLKMTWDRVTQVVWSVCQRYHEVEIEKINNIKIN